MFLSASQLEPCLLKRLEVLGDAAGRGLTHFVVSVLQAHNSAAGLEWSSNDGNEEGHNDVLKVNVQADVLAPQLEAWRSFVSSGADISKPQYYAAAHALAQGILGSILSGNEPAVQGAALDAAWQEDASGASSLPADRFALSLGTLATACSSDGTPQAAAACLSSLLDKVRGQGDRWQGLLKQYSRAGKGKSGGDSTAASTAGGKGGDNDAELDALLDEDEGDASGKPDVAPASDKQPATAGPAKAAAAAGGEEGGEGKDDDDGASSLGLSRIASRASTASAAPTVGTSAPASAAAGRYASTKSLLGPELRQQISRSLSGASSADLDELPGDLDALEQRQSSHQAASTTKQARKPLLAGLMASEEGKGHLAEMPTDIRSWADFKGKQAVPAGAAAGRQRNDVGGPGGSMALSSGKGALDQHLKGARASFGPGAGPPAMGGNPLHNAIIRGSASRQSAERERGGTIQGIVPGPPRGLSRNGSNESPVRQRSLAASFASNSSRKLSVSEPGPTGPQAEWKHLPALGQASRLHPAEMRQASRTALSRGNTGSPSASAAALIEDKLPMLPSLAGARGAPPKAMELLRRPSQLQRDAHHAGPAAQQPALSQAPRGMLPGAKSQLPGLGGGRGGPAPPSTGRPLPLPVKKSIGRGDRDF